MEGFLRGFGTLIALVLILLVVDLGSIIDGLEGLGPLIDPMIEVLSGDGF